MSLFTGAAIIGAALAAGTAGVAAAKINSGAAETGADAASKSNAAALEFQKQQAEADYKNQETTRKANYDQHVAQQTANNRIRQAMGLAPVDIPAYVPSVDPAFTGSSTPPPAAGGPSIGAMAGAPAAARPPLLGSQAAGGTPAPGTTTAPAVLTPQQRAAAALRAAPTSLQPEMQPMSGGFMGGSLGAMAGAPVLMPDGTYRLPSQLQRTM